MRVVHRVETGTPPRIDLETEKRAQSFCLEAIDAGLVRSAHDLSEGGLAIALAECAFHSQGLIGCAVELDDPIRPDALAFGETQSRILMTCRMADLDRLSGLARTTGIKLAAIGRTGGTDIVVRHRGRDLIRVPVEDAYRRWKDGIPKFYRVRGTGGR